MRMKQYQPPTLDENRRKIAFKLKKKTKMINSIFYLRRNANVIHEKVNQVNELFKMIEDVNEKLKAIDAAFSRKIDSSKR